MLRVRKPYLGDRGHDFRPDTNAVDGVVHCLLAVCHRQGWEFGAEPEADAGDWLLPDGMGPCCIGCGRCWYVQGGSGLAGMVEVDETYIGGEEPGLRGGRAPGKKVLTGVAVEIREPKGMGRCRIAPLADASAALAAPVSWTDHVEPGATVITDGWQGYSGLENLGYFHDRRSQRAARSRGEETGKLLPAVHQVSSLAKRWLLGTHQGSAQETHLASYLNEFVFRFNRPALPEPGNGLLFVCSSSPLPTTPCATRTSSPTVDLGKSRQRPRGCAGTRRVWCGLQRTARGEQPGRTTPVKWIPQNHPYPTCLDTHREALDPPAYKYALAVLQVEDPGKDDPSVLVAGLQELRLRHFSRPPGRRRPRVLPSDDDLLGQQNDHPQQRGRRRNSTQVTRMPLDRRKRRRLS